MYNQIPQQLKDLNNWLCFDDRDKDYFKDLSELEINQEKKRPRDLQGKAIKSWQNKGFSFNQCIESIKNGYNTGLGLVLKNNGIVILDYDKVLQEVEVNDKLGYIKPIFKDADKEKSILSDINTLKSYTEISPSGKGLHIVVLSDIKDLYITKPIEIYSKSKYIRFSGNSIFDFDINYCSTELLDIINKYKADIKQAKPLKFNSSVLKLFLDRNFKYKNGKTPKQILKIMFNCENGKFLQKLFYNDISDDDYKKYKLEKLSNQLKKSIITKEYYERAINKIDTTDSGKSFTLIMYLLDFCYGDIATVSKIFKMSKLCKAEYLKPKYYDDTKTFKIDKADYMIKKAIVGVQTDKGIINRYKNYRLKD